MKQAAVIVFVFLSILICAGESQPTEDALLARFRTTSADLWTTKQPPIQITASLRFFHMMHGEMTGEWIDRWNGPTEWRSELRAAGFTEFRGRAQGVEWQSTSFPSPFVRAIEFSVAMARLQHSQSLESRSKAKIVHKKTPLGPAVCIEYAPIFVDCHDRDSGVLLSAEDGFFRFEYSNYQPFRGKLLPRTVRVYEGKNLVIDGDLKAEDGDVLPANALQPPAGARIWSVPECSGSASFVDQRVLAGRAVSQPRPVYPESAKARRISGSVVFWAIIGADGTVHEPVLIHSAGKDLDEAALNSILQWRYKPYERCGTPVQVETTITVKFALSY